MADNLQVSAKVSDQKIIILTLSVVRRDGAITPFKLIKFQMLLKRLFSLKQN